MKCSRIYIATATVPHQDHPLRFPQQIILVQDCRIGFPCGALPGSLSLCVEDPFFVFLRRMPSCSLSLSSHTGWSSCTFSCRNIYEVFGILYTPSKVYKLAFGTFETSFNAPFGTSKTSLLQLGLWNIQNIEKMFWMFQTSLNPPSLPPSSLLLPLEHSEHKRADSVCTKTVWSSSHNHNWKFCNFISCSGMLLSSQNSEFLNTYFTICRPDF